MDVLKALNNLTIRKKGIDPTPKTNYNIPMQIANTTQTPPLLLSKSQTFSKIALCDTSTTGSLAFAETKSAPLKFMPLRTYGTPRKMADVASRF